MALQVKLRRWSSDVLMNPELLALAATEHIEDFWRFCAPPSADPATVIIDKVFVRTQPRDCEGIDMRICGRAVMRPDEDVG